MKKSIGRNLNAWMACVLIATNTSASPVWHCSRNTNDDNTAIATPAQEDQFSIASINSSAEVIGVSVRDLIDIYTGTPARIGGLPLSACFLAGNEQLTHEALSSLGVQLKTIEALARKSSIVQNNLHYVSDETQMRACIAKNFPAVGYLSKPVDSAKIMPCF
jgi:hypothetical protein